MCIAGLYTASLPKCDFIGEDKNEYLHVVHVLDYVQNCVAYIKSTYYI